MEKEIKITYQQYSTFEELDTNQQKIITAAENAKKNAYVPYSNFKVGAALLLEDGSIIQGNNQENKSYPVGMCAERNALFTYGAMGRTSPILLLGIVGDGELLDKDDIFSPCGACRQTMAEYTSLQDKPFKIILKNNDNSYTIFDGIHQILPFIFGNKQG